MSLGECSQEIAMYFLFEYYGRTKMLKLLFHPAESCIGQAYEQCSSVCSKSAMREMGPLVLPAQYASGYIS
eukprot:1161127-Pelagomonas_calceolata.AAC.7